MEVPLYGTSQKARRKDGQPAYSDILLNKRKLELGVTVSRTRPKLSEYEAHFDVPERM